MRIRSADGSTPAQVPSASSSYFIQKISCYNGSVRIGVIIIITLEKAKKALEASEKKAKELGVSVSTTVVDEHGIQIAASKMEGAFYISPRFSFEKAFTAANLMMATGDLLAFAADNKPYFGVNTLFGGQLTAIAGGLPVKDGDKVIGAVGVGGSADTAQDVECAKEAVKVLEEN